MFILPFLFFVTAILYSSVGFGGGSTYLALLLIWGIPYKIFPVIALCCNIIVVSGNCLNYIGAGNINIKILIPYLFSSVPLAFIGGSIELEKNSFEKACKQESCCIQHFKRPRSARGYLVLF